MEDAPYRNTRSSAGSQSKDEKLCHNKTLMENNVFATPESNATAKKLESKRVRTPSGNLITSLVGDIRNFFEVEQSSSSPKLYSGHRYNSQEGLQNQSPITQAQSGMNSASSRKPRDTTQASTVKANKLQSSKKAKLSDKPTSAKQLNSLFQTSQESNTMGPPDTPNVVPSQQPQQVSQDQPVTQTIKSSFTRLQQLVKMHSEGAKPKTNTTTTQNKTDINNSCHNQQDNITRSEQKEQQEDTYTQEKAESQLHSQETSSEQQKQPKVMDLQIVMRMFKEIKSDLTNFKKDTDIEKLRSITFTQDQQSDSLALLQKELANYKIKNEVLSSVVCSLSTKLTDMEGRLVNLERKSIQNSVVISGLVISSYGELRKFFAKCLDLKELEIDGYYNIGPIEDGKPPPPLVVTLSTLQDKQRVLSNKKKLKKMSEEGNQIYINDLQTPEITEKKRREREIFQDNNMNTVNKIEMSFFKGGLKIQNEPYKKKIMAPTPEEILKMTTEELNQTLSLRIKQGPIVNVQGNKFVAYSYEAQNHQQIRSAYAHMKLMYPEANHIILGYNIPGTLKHYSQDFFDDGDFGMGKHVLNLLVGNNIQCRAMFVTRYSASTKLGPKRFEAIRQAVKQAIDLHPKNRYTGSEQKITQLWPQKPKKTMQKTEQNHDNQATIHKQVSSPNGYSAMRNKPNSNSPRYTPEPTSPRYVPGLRHSLPTQYQERHQSPSQTIRHQHTSPAQNQYQFAPPKPALMPGSPYGELSEQSWPRLGSSRNPWN